MVTKTPSPTPPASPKSASTNVNKKTSQATTAGNSTHRKSFVSPQKPSHPKSTFAKVLIKEEKPETISQIIDIEKLQKMPKQQLQQQQTNIKKPDFWFNRNNSEQKLDQQKSQLNVTIPSVPCSPANDDALSSSSSSSSGRPSPLVASRSPNNFAQLEKKHLEFLNSQFKQLQEQNQQLKQVGFLNESSRGPLLASASAGSLASPAAPVSPPKQSPKQSLKQPLANSVSLPSRTINESLINLILDASLKKTSGERKISHYSLFYLQTKNTEKFF